MKKMWSSLFLFLFLLVMQQQQLLSDNYASLALKTEENSRVKRLVDGPPRQTKSPEPLTSEEMREMESGTESPHLYDYPESIYKNPEIRKGEWTSDPLPKTKTKTIAKVDDGHSQNQIPLLNIPNVSTLLGQL